MHECPECGEACDCDEGQIAAADCEHCDDDYDEDA